MKSTSSMFRILSIAVLIATVLLFGIQIISYYTDPLATSVVYPASAEDSVNAEGWIVREEETFHVGTGILFHPLREGERVGAGQVMATAYNSVDAVETVDRIEDKQLRLEQLEFALRSYPNPDAALQLDSAINDSLLALRSNVSNGDYAVATDDLSALKANILKRSHSYTSSEEIQKDIQKTQKQIRKLEKSLSDATVVRAQRSGTYSSDCDGYEQVLTPKFLQKITPSRLRSIKPGSETADVGKLIYGENWYYTAILSEEEAHSFQLDEAVTLRFAKGLEMDVPARVYSISKAEQGECVVVWEADEYISQVASLRSIQADIIHNSHHGLRIPATALRLPEDGQAGVYCLVGVKARFKPVEVLYQSETYALVRPAADAREEAVLRSGDEVITTASKIDDGEVVRESA